jgi:hypothetical protein
VERHLLVDQHRVNINLQVVRLIATCWNPIRMNEFALWFPVKLELKIILG